MAIAVVCDGHGGKRYFRSDVGARIAAEVAMRKVSEFLRHSDSLVLAGAPFTRIPAVADNAGDEDFNCADCRERALRLLAASIIFDWYTEIRTHAGLHPLLDLERSRLGVQWIEEFDNGRNLEKVYGSTMILYARTPEFWFAFQIGDGKCFAFSRNGEWCEPIPWDDRCFLSKTTSISDDAAILEFRFCYRGDGVFPAAVILASDGIDDSFGPPENQADFYIQILKSIVSEGVDETAAEIESTLPQLSKIGSRDDMSIAMVFDEEWVRAIYPALIEWQISEVQARISEEDAKLDKAFSVLKAFDGEVFLSRNDQISVRYAESDRRRARENKELLESRLSTLRAELDSVK